MVGDRNAKFGRPIQYQGY